MSDPALQDMELILPKVFNAPVGASPIFRRGSPQMIVVAATRDFSTVVLFQVLDGFLVFILSEQ